MSVYRLIMAGIFVASTVSAGPDSEPTGWLWYKEELAPEKQTSRNKKEDPKEGQISPPAQLTAVERLAVIQKRFEEAKAEAILNPTLENATHVRHLHDRFLIMSTRFQENWSLSEALDSQRELTKTSPGALEIKRDLDEKDLTQKLKILSQTHGLLFVSKKGCAYCEGFAPLVMKFAQEHGFEVDALSADDGCFEGMKCTRNVNAVNAINPSREFPLLFLVNPQTHEIIPLAKGYLSRDDLLANAKQIIRYLEGNRS